MFEVTARLKIREGELEGFKQQAAEMMRLTRELDTKTLRYDWFVSNDGTECEVRELSAVVPFHRYTFFQGLDPSVEAPEEARL